MFLTRKTQSAQTIQPVVSLERESDEFGRVEFALDKEPQAEASVHGDGKEAQIAIACIPMPAYLRFVQISSILVTKKKIVIR